MLPLFVEAANLIDDALLKAGCRFKAGTMFKFNCKVYAAMRLHGVLIITAFQSPNEDTHFLLKLQFCGKQRNCWLTWYAKALDRCLHINLGDAETAETPVKCRILTFSWKRRSEVTCLFKLLADREVTDVPSNRIFFNLVVFDVSWSFRALTFWNIFTTPQLN